MGGMGSGRCPGLSGAPTCESTHSIDLAVLRRRGLLRQGHRKDRSNYLTPVCRPTKAFRDDSLIRSSELRNCHRDIWPY
jgi:hypothetical protein